MICTWVFTCLKVNAMRIFDPALNKDKRIFLQQIDIDGRVGKINGPHRLKVMILGKSKINPK
jgi:hypothetical protein